MPIRRYRMTSPTPMDSVNKLMPTGAQVTAQSSVFGVLEQDWTVAAGGEADLDEVLAGMGWTLVSAAPTTPLGTKQVPILIQWNGVSATYPRLLIAPGSTGYCGFAVPDDFGTLVEAYLYAIPWTNIVANPGVGLASNYGKPGESPTAASEADAGFSFAAPVANLLYKMSLASVLTGIEPGDVVGVSFAVSAVAGDNINFGVQGWMNYTPQ